VIYNNFIIKTRSLIFMGHNQSKKQSYNIPHIVGNPANQASRLRGVVKNRGIKNTKKPSKGK